MANFKRAPRRQERVLAFKVLYGLCFSPAVDLEALEQAFIHSPDTPAGMDSAAAQGGFAWELTLGVWQQQKSIDNVLSRLSQNWKVERMARVELTLLRIAMFELMFRKDVPPKVAINEAIELSKQFGDDKSRGFVNGILDAAAKALDAGTLQPE